MTRLVALLALLALAAGRESSFWPTATECRLACLPRPVRSLIRGACVCSETVIAERDGGAS